MDLMSVCVEAGVTLLLSFGGCAAMVRSHARRLESLETSRLDAPKVFVPRTEFDLLRELIRRGGERGLTLQALEGAAGQHFEYSPDGITLTQGFEGLRLQTYPDIGGVLTIGYGHTGPDVKPGMVITIEQAIALLRADVASAVACVNHGVTATINQCEFDALVDFAFNAGNVAFLHSTLLRDLNAGNFEAAAKEFERWVNVGGHTSAGLLRRRLAEEKLFLRDPQTIAKISASEELRAAGMVMRAISEHRGAIVFGGGYLVSAAVSTMPPPGAPIDLYAWFYRFSQLVLNTNALHFPQPQPPTPPQEKS